MKTKESKKLRFVKFIVKCCLPEYHIKHKPTKKIRYGGYSSWDTQQLKPENIEEVAREVREAQKDESEEKGE